MGHKVGDVVEVEVPEGKLKFKVLVYTDNIR